MTRRVIIAIIVNVWLVLLAAGCSAYFITQSLLLADLDETIVSRVASLPEIQRSDVLPQLRQDARDRYVIQNASGQRRSSLTQSPEGGGLTPTVLARNTSRLADGTRLRTLTLKAYARPANPADRSEPVTVIYSASAEHVDALLWRLLYSFFFFGILAALASILSARWAARAALRPMRETAEVIGKIDERSLDHRLSIEKLPPELVPVGIRLNAMLARLEGAFAQRRQFLANASHELRTPVAALVTALEVALRRQRTNEEYVRVLDQSLSDAQLLNHLVVALVEQARLDRLGDDPEFGPVALPLLLRRCISTLAGQSQKKGIHLDLDLRDQATIFTDEGLLRSAILNLLSNAVEYTPILGKITLSATFADLDTALPESLRQAVPEGVAFAPRLLTLCVRDNGPGIKAEYIANIFEPFYRADASRTDSRHHLGLGLAAVRLSVRSLGGECTVESPPRDGGTGCIFRIELPIALAVADKAAAGTPFQEPIMQERA